MKLMWKLDLIHRSSKREVVLSILGGLSREIERLKVEGMKARIWSLCDKKVPHGLRGKF